MYGKRSKFLTETLSFSSYITCAYNRGQNWHNILKLFKILVQAQMATSKPMPDI